MDKEELTKGKSKSASQEGFLRFFLQENKIVIPSRKTETIIVVFFNIYNYYLHCPTKSEASELPNDAAFTKSAQAPFLSPVSFFSNPLL